MEDTQFCPLCNKKMFNVVDIKNFNGKNKKYIVRTCKSVLGHFYKGYYDPQSKLIDYCQVTLNNAYSITYHANFLAETSAFYASQKKHSFVVNLEKVLELDFPNLSSLKAEAEYYLSMC